MSLRKCTLACAGFVAGVALLWGVPVAFGAKNSNPGVLPPNSTCYGASYAEWAGRWWTWALAQPLPDNPITDVDGSDGALGQSGKVWFLAGTDGSMLDDLPVTRDVTVPSGKAIFFPLVNNVWITIPANEYYPSGDPPFSEPGAEEFARMVLADEAYGGIDGTDTLECDVDGVALADLYAYRAPSTVFTAQIPDDYANTWGFGPYLDHGGPYTDCVADGYWIMLAPLSKGSHTVHLKGGNSSTGFVTEVYYNITVQ